MTVSLDNILRNKVIAQFMGATFVEKDIEKESNQIKNSYPIGEYWRCSFTPDDNFSWFFPNGLEYHKSIVWQYDVLKKILNIWKEEDFKDDGMYGVYFVECFNAWDSLDFEEIHNAIYQFAVHYLKEHKK